MLENAIKKCEICGKILMDTSKLIKESKVFEDSFYIKEYGYMNILKIDCKKNCGEKKEYLEYKTGWQGKERIKKREIVRGLKGKKNKLMILTKNEVDDIKILNRMRKKDDYNLIHIKHSNNGINYVIYGKCINGFFIKQMINEEITIKQDSIVEKKIINVNDE